MRPGMEIKAQAYWDKSKENLEVCRMATDRQYFNAAASRYYYALRLAAQALFETRGVYSNDPRGPSYWGHSDLVQETVRLLSIGGHSSIDADRWLNEARTLRNRGDYKLLDVHKDEIDYLVKNSVGLFEVIENEIASRGKTAGA